LEQFEPVPGFLIFLGGIDLSITNVTIIFIYIILVLAYFLSGHLFFIDFNDKLRLVYEKKNKNIDIIGYDYDINTVYSLHKGFFIVTNFFTNKAISYVLIIANNFFRSKEIKSIKDRWVAFRNIYYISGVESEYSREFHKAYYFILKNGTLDLFSNYSLFNNIQLYFTSFLNTLYILSKRTYLDESLFGDRLVIKVNSFLKKALRSIEYFIPYFSIYVFQNIYNVILGMIKENIGGSVVRAIRFFPFIFTLFIFILSANLIGLIPYSSTVTSYLIITFAAAVMVLVGVNIIAGRFHGLTYFGHFLPAGCPFALYPLIIPIEFISYVFRVVSLSVRLFANMMAGHTLLAVLAGFGWTMANASSELFVLQIFPIFVVFVLVFLETAVAIIQAYVFTILTCMYLDEAINLH